MSDSLELTPKPDFVNLDIQELYKAFSDRHLSTNLYKKFLFLEMYIETMDFTMSRKSADISTQVAREFLKEPYVQKLLNDHITANVMGREETLYRLSDLARGIHSIHEVSVKEQLAALKMMAEYHKLFVQQVEVKVEEKKTLIILPPKTDHQGAIIDAEYEEQKLIEAEANEDSNE